MKKLILMVGCLVLLATTNVVDASQITGLINQGVGTPITKTIRHLQPKLSWEVANKYAWDIFEIAERTGLSWKLLVAITFQESSFTHFKGDKVCGLMPNGVEACVWRSFGPMHVYYNVWKNRLKLVPLRLLNDVRYGFESGVRVLQTMKKLYAHKDKYWIGRYNSGTYEYKMRYYRRITHHLDRIEAFLGKQVSKTQWQGVPT